VLFVGYALGQLVSGFGQNYFFHPMGDRAGVLGAYGGPGLDTPNVKAKTAKNACRCLKRRLQLQDVNSEYQGLLSKHGRISSMTGFQPVICDSIIRVTILKPPDATIQLCAESITRGLKGQ
jgi:hypothetical protein